MEFNDRLAQLRGSPTLEVADRIRDLEAAGDAVWKLQTGDPDFDTPPAIVAAANAAMRSGLTHYSDTRGLPELRTALSVSLHNDFAMDYDPESEIVITHGGVHGIFVAMQALLNPGDEVLIPEPCWMPYVAAATLAGGHPVFVPTKPEDRFKLQAADIERLATPRTKVLVVNTPNNPTGATLDWDELSDIVEVTERLGIWIIADEVYERLVYDDREHIKVASFDAARDRTVTVGSFSKTYAMTGWRLGYVAAPKQASSAMLKAAQYTVTNVSPFVQKAGVTALTDPSVAKSVAEMRAKYGARRRQLIDTLGSIDGIRFHEPEGAFYFMLDVREWTEDSAEFASGLLESQKVGVVPGAGFGPSGEGHIRITFAAAEEVLAEGVRGIAEYVSGLR